MSESELAPVLNIPDVFTVISESNVFSLLNTKNYSSVNWSSPTDPIAVILSSLITRTLSFVQGMLKNSVTQFSHPVIIRIIHTVIVYFIYTYNPENKIPQTVIQNFSGSLDTLLAIQAGTFLLSDSDRNLLLQSHSDESFLYF